MAHTRLNPLLRWARGRHRAAAEPDFGDHGTAFGLELTMTPEPGSAEGASLGAAPASSASPVPAASPPAGARGALRRAWRIG